MALFDANARSFERSCNDAAASPTFPIKSADTKRIWSALFSNVSQVSPMRVTASSVMLDNSRDLCSSFSPTDSIWSAALSVVRFRSLDRRVNASFASSSNLAARSDATATS